MESLEAVRVREVPGEGFRAFLQFNPKRIVSTGAKVDAKSIQARRCFLCVDNLPEPQKGILYHGEYLILCNPAPIFRPHLTISNVRHLPQTLEPNIDVMLRLARDLSPLLSVFYNGPKCGASAPDHMHFQASPTGAIPVETDVAAARRTGERKTSDGVEVFALDGYGREAVVLNSGDPAAMAHAMRALFSAMQEVMKTSDEPLMNVIASYADACWRVIVFLRRVHRPAAYFREGDAQVLISPAAVDIGGLVVTPLERDFHRVDAALLASIFAEESVDRSVTADILRAMHS
jgi:hypothetical protein